MATGVVNTWNLVGSLPALAETDYGELLSLKMVLFIVMVGIAAVNRLLLLPRLPSTKITRQLRRNVVLEMALATVIIFIVGALGTMPPAMLYRQEMPMKHHYYVFAGLAVTICASLMSLAVMPHPAWAQ
jgi:hypothetical protein